MASRPHTIRVEDRVLLGAYRLVEKHFNSPPLGIGMASALGFVLRAAVRSAEEEGTIELPPTAAGVAAALEALQSDRPFLKLGFAPSKEDEAALLDPSTTTTEPPSDAFSQSVEQLLEPMIKETVKTLEPGFDDLFLDDASPEDLCILPLPPVVETPSVKPKKMPWEATLVPLDSLIGDPLFEEFDLADDLAGVTAMRIIYAQIPETMRQTLDAERLIRQTRDTVLKRLAERGEEPNEVLSKIS